MFTNRHPITVYLITVFLLLVPACSPSTQNIETQNIEGEHWIIFSAEQAEEQGIGSWFAGNDTLEYWTPAEEDVLALEGGLASFLEETPDLFHSQEKPVWERLDEYNAQYIGMVLDGKQVIYANYLCDSAQLQWRENFVFVADGGDCFFQFKYDVESADYFDLQVNGNA